MRQIRPDVSLSPLTDPGPELAPIPSIRNPARSLNQVHPHASDTDGMTRPGHELEAFVAPGSLGYSRELAQLAEQVRTTVTPVVGYLELTSQTALAGPTSQDLPWISTI